MRFLFVDKIDGIEGDRIRGRTHFPADEPMRYGNLAGKQQIAPGAISEALGQLASWLCIERGGFRARPIFLFADKINIDRHLPPATTVNMDCTVSAMDEETFNFSGVATVEGKRVAAIENCNGYFLPLDQLEDPEVTRCRFQSLTSGGLQLSGRGGNPFPFDSLVDEIVEKEQGKLITTTKRFSNDSPFYSDHFPRFPVTPIVILNEMIGVAAKRMLGLREDQEILAREVSGIKIRSFVKPGEECTVKVQVMKDEANEATPGERSVTTIAEIHKDGKRILRGRYLYQIKGAGHA